MNEIVKKYTDIDEKLFMTIDEAVELSRELAKRARQTNIQFDEVVGIANGARLMTNVVANNLGVPYQMLTIRRKGSLVKNYLGKFPFIVHLFSFWYRIPLLNYPLITVMRKMGKLADENEQKNEARFKGKKNILIVDDVLEIGSTIQAAKQIIKNDSDQCNTVVAVISWSVLKSDEEQLEKADIFINRKVQHFPWSVNNPHYQEYKTWLIKNDA